MRRLLSLALCTVLAAWIVVGCAGPGAAERDAPPSFPEDYRRVVSPAFAVVDSAGTAYSHPFYGGLNVPRPEFVDVDTDGDLDLFVQEQAGELAFFENVSGESGADSSRLRWRTDHFQHIELGEWFRFADLDQDGDPDLLVERPFSYIRVYRNTGSEGNPQFELFTDTLRTPSGKPIFSDRQNIPNVTDIDCDGQLDLFLGKLDGTVARYEARGDTAGIPFFEKVTDRFEDIEIVNQQMASARHGANTLAFADVDDDGDQDLFWGDFFEPGLLLIENTGTCEDPNLRTSPQPFPPSDPVKTSGYNAPTLADWTGNGRLDLFVGVLGGAFDANTTLSENFLYYAQTDRGFERRDGQFLGTLDVGSESTTAWGDIDGDGDIDGLVANKIDPGQGQTSRIYVLENTGQPGNPTYRMRSPIDLPRAYHLVPALGDVTANGVLDLVVGTWKGRVLLAPGTGDGRFESPRELVALDRGSNAVPALGDLTGNGRLDLVVGEAGGSLSFYRNTGPGADTSARPSFKLETDAFADVSVQDRSAPALHDVDGDGDLDLLVGSQAEGLRLVRNTGGPQTPAFAAPDSVALPVPRFSAPRFADLDGNGVADLVVGTEGGGLILWLGRE